MITAKLHSVQQILLEEALYTRGIILVAIVAIELLF